MTEISAAERREDLDPDEIHFEAEDLAAAVGRQFAVQVPPQTDPPSRLDHAIGCALALAALAVFWGALAWALVSFVRAL